MSANSRFGVRSSEFEGGPSWPWCLRQNRRWKDWLELLDLQVSRSPSFFRRPAGGARSWRAVQRKLPDVADLLRIAWANVASASSAPRVRIHPGRGLEACNLRCHANGTRPAHPFD